MERSDTLLSIPFGEAVRDAAVCCPGIEEHFDARFFRALGDSNRVAILIQLARCLRPCTVTELSACCPVDLSVVSRHLGVLRDAGIVEAEKRGKQVFYSARLTDVAERLGAIAAALQQAASVRPSSCCQPDGKE